MPDVWIDSAFQRRFATPLERALVERTKHVIGAVSGAGKTTAMLSLERRHPVTKSPDGQTSAPVVAAVSTDADERSQSALIRRIIKPIGTPPALTVTALEDWFLGQAEACQTRLLVFDDSQDFGLAELRRIKKLGDRLQLEHGMDIGMCFLVASEGEAIPLRDLLVGTANDTYRQFRRRFSQEHPWSYVPALSEDELGEVLVGFEQVFAEMVPGMHIERWAARIHRHLSSAYFDPYATGRVTMQNVQNLVLAIVQRLVARQTNVVSGDLVDEAAEALCGGALVTTAEEQWQSPE
jgi:hypothetical protein